MLKLTKYRKKEKCMVYNINLDSKKFKKRNIKKIVFRRKENLKEIKNKLTKSKFVNIKKCIIIMGVLILFILFYNAIYGADPTLVTRLNSALKKIQDYFVKISAPAASVAIAVGVMMRKFSFGDEEKMRIGKKVIFNAVICYGVIISTDLIIKFVDSVL